MQLFLCSKSSAISLNLIGHHNPNVFHIYTLHSTSSSRTRQVTPPLWNGRETTRSARKQDTIWRWFDSPSARISGFVTETAWKCNRFDTITDLLSKNPQNSPEETLDILNAASVSWTQWTCVYHLDDFSVEVALDNHYSKVYRFSKNDFQWTPSHIAPSSMSDALP